MQTIHQEGQEFLGVLLVIPPHLGHKPVNHTLQTEIIGQIHYLAHQESVV